MNIHTVTAEVTGNIKPMVANAEAFGEAIKVPHERKVTQDWMEQEKRSQRGESDL